MSCGSASQPSPPFDASTFNPLSLSKETRSRWGRHPSLTMADGSGPTKYDAKSAKEYWRIMLRTNVSPAVFALGKNPYPGLHQRRFIQELQTYTPEYDVHLPWMGENSVLMYITPTELQKLGCINLETVQKPNIDISPQFQVDTATLALAGTNRKIVSFIGDNQHIHPAFRRRNWLNTSDAEYEYLKPVLRIATKMMAMDGYLDLWTALGQPMQKLPQNKMLLKQKEENWVYYTGRSTPAQRMQTQSEMNLLRHYVTFSWKHYADEAGGTTSDPSLNGLRPGGTRHACKVEIDAHFRYIICRGGTEFNASHYNPAASDASAYMRTQLFLANTLVHEMTHVWLENVAGGLGRFHPFRNDDRLSEEGWAAETTIHKDVLIEEMETNLDLRTMPFGMRADRWPGAGDENGAKIRASAAKNGIKFNTSYAVPMSYVHQFFQDDFWDNRILRFGDGALSNYKAVGVRLCRSGDLKFEALESPTIRQTLDPLTGKMVEDPEIDPDAEFPDVDEGIIYPDKVLTLLGEEISDPDTKMQDAAESEEEDSDDEDGGITI